ncbi:MAG TPA: hypothetical protein G4N94_12915, partial [Caldilineae bacterium]|nr:hypothetical protein [Caldilineae bacterium]
GIYATDSDVTIEDSTISGNSVGYGGGGVHVVDHSTLTVKNSTITDNSANDGGGIFGGDSSSLTIQDNTTISDNTATSRGGGVHAEDQCTVSVVNSTVTNNTVEGYDGGGIAVIRSSTLTLNGSTLSGNSATYYGGGIYANESSVTVEGTTISGNTAQNSAGGGIFSNNQASITVRNSAITGNTSGYNGGALFAGLGSSVTIENATISGNSAADGGGIFGEDNQTSITLANSTLSNNSASSHGGGIHSKTGSSFVVKNSIVAAQATGTDCYINGGSISSSGYNLESGDSCGFTSAGDLQNTDPKLNPLSNGVMTPKSDSPAIDGGNPADPGSSGDACLANDQRGNARDDLRCDMGAVEVQLSDTDTVIKDVSGAGTFTFGPTLVKIEVTNQGGLSQLQVQHHDGDHPDATRMNGQWWGITPTGSGFTANLDLPHMVTPDANAKVCKHVSGSTWDCARDGSTADRVWRNGLTEFSDWAVGDNVGPTAVTLRDFAAGGGPDGLGAVLWGGMLAVLAGVGAWLGLRREYDNETETSPAPAPRFGTET